MKLVILSTNHNLYSTRRLVEAGKKKGHDMHVIDHSKCDLVIEKRKPGLIYRTRAAIKTTIGRKGFPAPRRRGHSKVLLRAQII